MNRKHTPAPGPAAARHRIPLGAFTTRVGLVVAAVALVALGPLALVGGAGADSSLAGYAAGALGVGAQFAWNVPGVVPLPNENLIEEDVPFARTNLGEGPVVDSIGASYYPGDIAASLGSLLAEFGAPPSAGQLNDTNLAHTQYPNSPSAGSQASFGESPSQASPASPSVFYSTSDATSGGGDATGYVTDFALDDVGAVPAATSALPSLGSASQSTSQSTSQSMVDVGNVSANDKVTLTDSSITSTATSQVNGIQIAGLVDISGITSTANATSDGTTGTPTGSLHMGQVTVDGESAYIDSTGLHITSTTTPAASITPAQLQQTVDATLSQDGISIRLLDPKLTTQGAAASADAGGLAVSISHQIDVPFIPGEPTIPVPELGNEGLPAGLYTVTTSITFGMAQANVQAAGVTSSTGNTGAASTTAPSTPTTTGNTGTFSGNTGNTGFGSFVSGGGSSVQSLQPTGPGSAAASQLSTPLPSTATGFPIRGIPAPVGWAVAALLSSLLGAYPFLLLAKWQFTPGRRR